jgi:hypothetical protein
MVPVNVRSEEEDGGPGNRLTFMFVDLPCDEPDPLRAFQMTKDAYVAAYKAGDMESEEYDAPAKAANEATPQWSPRPRATTLRDLLSEPEPAPTSKREG